MPERASGRATTTDALLTLGDGEAASVADADGLLDALAGLPRLTAGETARLSKASNHYVEATRRREFWSVVSRRGGWWTTISFTADMTTEFSARQVQASRAAKSSLASLMQSWRDPPPEHAISTRQVETIFQEYFSDSAFSIPVAGA